MSVIIGYYPWTEPSVEMRTFDHFGYSRRMSRIFTGKLHSMSSGHSSIVFILYILI